MRMEGFTCFISSTCEISVYGWVNFAKVWPHWCKQSREPPPQDFCIGYINNNFVNTLSNQLYTVQLTMNRYQNASKHGRCSFLYSTIREWYATGNFGQVRLTGRFVVINKAGQQEYVPAAVGKSNGNNCFYS